MILIGCLVGQAWAQAHMGATQAASTKAVKLLFNMGVSNKRASNICQTSASMAHRITF